MDVFPVEQTRTFLYTIDSNADLQRPEVAASHRNGTYAQPIEVVFTLTDNRPAPLAAYYTLDGSDPTTTSPIYVQGNAVAGLAGPPLPIARATPPMSCSRTSTKSASATARTLSCRDTSSRRRSRSGPRSRSA